MSPCPDLFPLPHCCVSSLCPFEDLVLCISHIPYVSYPRILVYYYHVQMPMLIRNWASAFPCPCVEECL